MMLFDCIDGRNAGTVLDIGRQLKGWLSTHSVTSRSVMKNHVYKNEESHVREAQRGF